MNEGSISAHLAGNNPEYVTSVVRHALGSRPSWDAQSLANWFELRADLVREAMKGIEAPGAAAS